jgi:ACT domain
VALWCQVANRAGSLADITGVIASHGINVQSLAVGSSEQPGRSRITVVVPRDDAGLASLKQKVAIRAALPLGSLWCAASLQPPCSKQDMGDVAMSVLRRITS